MSYLERKDEKLQAYSQIAVKRSHFDDFLDIFGSKNGEKAEEALPLPSLKKMKTEMDPVNPFGTPSTFFQEQQIHDKNIETQFVAILVLLC